METAKNNTISDLYARHVATEEYLRVKLNEIKPPSLECHHTFIIVYKSENLIMSQCQLCGVGKTEANDG